MYSAELLYTTTRTKYYLYLNEIEPTPEQKLLWEFTGMPEGVTRRTITDKTVLETFTGKTKKQISRIADNNLWSGKYPQVRYLGCGEGDVTLIFK